MSYDGSDDKEELELFPIISQNNNNSNGVHDSDSSNKNQENMLMKISMKKSK